MPPLKRYNRQLGPTSTSLGPMQGSVGLTSGATDLGRTVGNIGVQYADKKNQARYKSEVADYEISKRQFDRDLSAQKTEYLQNGGDFRQMIDKVVKPETDKFMSGIDQKGYLNASRDNIKNEWGVERENIITREDGIVEQMEIDEYAMNQGDLAYMAMEDGDIELAENIYEGLKGQIGPERVYQMKNAALADQFNMRMRSNAELALDGSMSTDDFMADMDAVQEETAKLVKNGTLAPATAKRINLEATAKRYDYKKKIASVNQKSFDEATKLFTDPSASSDELSEAINGVTDPSMRSLLESSMRQGVEARALTDSDVKKALESMNKFNEGKITAEKMFKKAETGDYAGLMTLFANNSLRDKASKGEWVASYEMFSKGRKLKESDDVSLSFMNSLTSVVDGLDTGHSKFTEQKLKAYSEWRGDNPNPSQEETAKFMNKEFYYAAEKNIQKINVRQNSVMGMPVISTQEEYDALPAGSEYAESDGKRYRK